MYVCAAAPINVRVLHCHGPRKRRHEVGRRVSLQMVEDLLDVLLLRVGTLARVDNLAWQVSM